jgi:acetoin utilization deacetylase AcuC-like enzyme
MHEAFGLHDPGFGHPERPARYAAVTDAVGRAGARIAEAPRAAPDDLERVHAPAYLELVERFCRSGGGALDPDTVVGPVSWEAAVRAAGGAVAAVDEVAAGASAAFSLGRPPGHHAEPSRAMGFCVLNSAAVAAAHARDALGMERVAVLDWDAHHGNGTQAAFWADPAVLYVSLHQWPFYPGTGAREERGEGEGEGSTVNVPLPAGTSQERYLEAFRTEALPALTAFAPEILIVSAGFDAHRDDPLCSLGLDAGGFATLTAELDGIGAGRAFVLEGGYDLNALRDSLDAVIQAVTQGSP